MAAHHLSMSVSMHKNQVGQAGTGVNGGEFAKKLNSGAQVALSAAERPGLIETVEGARFLPLDDRGVAGYEVVIDGYRTVKMFVRGDGAGHITLHEDGPDEQWTSNVPTTGFGDAPAGLQGLQHRNEIRRGAFTYTPFVTADRAGLLIEAQGRGFAMVSLVPSVETGEGDDTANAFVYVTDDPSVDDLGDANAHLAFGASATDD